VTDKRQIPAAFAKGYVLCSPSGKLQPNTWNETAAKAIASKYRKRDTWEKAQRRGWSVQFVYVRFFIPVFKATFTTTEIREAYDVEDI
jgi:hypothetical protein